MKRVVLSILIAVMAAMALTAREARAEEAPGWYEDQRGFSLKLSTGGGLRALYSVPIQGVDVAFSAGAQTRAGGFYWLFGVLAGSTEHGLSTRQFRMGASWEAPIGRLHVGLSPRASLLMIDRASVDESLIGVGLGGAALLGVDVFVGSTVAVYLALEGSADFYDGGGDDTAVLAGGTLALGARLFNFREPTTM